MSLDRIWRFMDPATQARIVAQEKRRDKDRMQSLIKAGKAVAWDDMRTKFQSELVITGYQPYQLWEPKPIPVTQAWPDNAHSEVLYTDNGHPDYRYAHRTWPVGIPLELAQGNRRGKVWVAEESVIPVLIKAGRDSHEVMMSITPMEIMTQRRGVQLATGTVLVGGLGLGWFLLQVCRKPSVKKVIVVESNSAVFTRVRERLLEKFPVEMKKVSDWIMGDVFDHLGKHGDDTRYLLDVWPSYGGCCSRYNAVKRSGKVKHLWGWGDLA